MGKYWKAPEYQQWVEFRCDGKIIGIETGSRTKNEEKRLRGLIGIDILPATSEAFIKFKVATKLPDNIIKKMESAWHNYSRNVSDQ